MPEFDTACTQKCIQEASDSTLHTGVGPDDIPIVYDYTRDSQADSAFLVVAFVLAVGQSSSWPADFVLGELGHAPLACPRGSGHMYMFSTPHHTHNKIRLDICRLRHRS